MKINFKNFIKTIKKGAKVVGDVSGKKMRETASLKGRVSDLKALNMYIDKIPTSLPKRVQQNAIKDLKGFIKKGNHRRAKDYISNLK